MEQQQWFAKNKAYRIVNRKTNFHLTDDLEVRAMQEKNKFSRQYWLVEQHKNSQYQILGLKFGNLFTQHQNKVTTEKERWSNGCQHWIFQEAQTVINNQGKIIKYFWICNRDSSLYLGLSGKNHQIKFVKKDICLYLYQWYFVKVQTHQGFHGVCNLQSSFSGFYADIPQSSQKAGTGVIQMKFSGKGSQRWVIHKYEQDSYTIKSLSSNLLLAPENGQCKLGARIIQDCHNNSLSQRWLIVKNPNDTYCIKSMANNNYFLTVSNNKQAGPLLLSLDKEKSQWIILGNFSQ